MLADPQNNGSPAFSKSARLLNWKIAEVDERLVVTFCQKMNLSEVLSSILVSRGIKSVDEAERFLNPKLKDHLPDPFSLKDMDLAASRIAQAVQNNEKVVIFGDYDVDGATSSALMKRFLHHVGLKAEVYIPHRITEGYGPNVAAFKKLKERGASLIITVDCGIVSFEPLQVAHDMGMDVIILDHHLSIETLPKAYAIVNPNRFDEDFAIKSIAAVGIVFLTIIAIRSKLREMDWFKGKEIDLLQYLDLVALGTVCDVMHLIGLNRAFVAQGLKLIAARSNLGISTLMDISKISTYPQSYHLGYVLGPRINAGGRVGEGQLGSDLLSTDDPVLAFKIVTKLETLNQERRTIEAIIIEEAIAQIENDELYLKPFILVCGKNWHQGVLGILASRIKERYSKPVAVISLNDGIGKGSARSVVGIDLGSLLALAKQLGLVLQGGGHAMAGGFSIEEHKIVEFSEFILNKLAGSEAIFETNRDYIINAVLTVNAINPSIIIEINKAAPFGNANPQPKFLLRAVNVINAKAMGKNSIMLIVTDSKFSNSGTLKCIMFKAMDNEFGNALLSTIGGKVDLVGAIQVNNYDMSKAEFVIEDFALHNASS